MVMSSSGSLEPPPIICSAASLLEFGRGSGTRAHSLHVGRLTPRNPCRFRSRGNGIPAPPTCRNSCRMLRRTCCRCVLPSFRRSAGRHKKPSPISPRNFLHHKTSRKARPPRCEGKRVISVGEATRKIANQNGHLKFDWTVVPEDARKKAAQAEDKEEILKTKNKILHLTSRKSKILLGRTASNNTAGTPFRLSVRSVFPGTV